jgi:hypothetical protein
MDKSFLKRIIPLVAIIIVVVLLAIGYYPSITGVVFDSETGEPIEGAVVLVGWSKTSLFPPGLPTTRTVKVSEAITDGEGKFKLPGIFNLRVNPPYLTVYKKGYVAWSNEYIFPDWEKRTDFKWNSGYVFKLEKFKPEYSFDDHVAFIGGMIKSAHGEKFDRALDWERTKARNERLAKDKKRNN